MSAAARLLLAACVLSGAAAGSAAALEPANASLKLAALFSDGAVLQRDRKIPVWGTAAPGTAVSVTLADRKASATADARGRWKVALDPLEAGGPHELTATAEGTTRRIKDILVGEVWLCSGQSNMEWPMDWRILNRESEIAKADFPALRMFTVAKAVAKEPTDALEGAWAAATPSSVGRFSAVGYFFGRELHRSLKVPVGLIHSSWGGIPAEAWTPRRIWESDPELASILERDRAHDSPRALALYAEDLENYEKARSLPDLPASHADPGDAGSQKGWAKPDLDASDWGEMELPGFWEPTMNIDGAVWFRRAVDIPGEWAGKELTLSLGALYDFDTAFFDGARVGATGPETPNTFSVPRRYTVPAARVKAGTSVIAVRVFDESLSGGFGYSRDYMTLGPADKPEEALSIAGPWKYRVELAIEPWRARLPKPLPPGGTRAAALYNAMIHPLAPYAMRGVVWYQGEADVFRARQYRTLLPAMIGAWRALWRQGDFPFLIAQLANYSPAKDRPSESRWAELREAQLLTLRTSPATGLAVNIDIGEAGDIHPADKQEVGRRLALWARARTYGENIGYSGPLYRSMRVEGESIRIFFDHADGGLVSRGGPLRRFEIADRDHGFAWADARIDGDTVVVTGRGLKEPAAVRYAWADNPEGCNLYNAAGLPASPFRTDERPGLSR